MDLAPAAATFPVIFIGELPDKTMFASLVLASRGRPVYVWAGAAAAFVAHVVIAVSIGVALFELLPHRVVDGIVAALFLVGAVFSWRSRHDEAEESDAAAARSPLRTALTAALVIFGAEWGDLTQILTANLAARYHDPLAVGGGAVLALWAVAAIAVLSGSSVTKVLSAYKLRVLTTLVLLGLTIYTTITAITG